MFKNIFKFSSSIFLLVAFLFSQNSYAQLTGTKTIPGDYATISAAITDLNTQGVGAGGVTFNVAAGHTETFSTDSAGFITASGTASDQIIFQKSGVGSNPLITASALGTITTSTSLTANGDGIIVIEGGDYITFDGIDLQENVAATGAQLMESGYFLKKLSGDDACKNVTIMNCNISLDKTTRYSYGIYISNLVGGSDATVTSTGGRSENIKIYGCTISDVYVGIQVRGDLASSPYDYYDQNIEIGVDGANSITDFGGGASTAYAIYAIYQNNIKIANTTINGGAGTTTTLYGMYLSTGTNSNVDIYNNTVTVDGGCNHELNVSGIYNSMGSTGTDNTVNIYNNIIENCTYPTATSGTFYMLYNNGSAFTVNIYDNIVRNNTKGGTGSAYLLYNSNTGAGGTENNYNNSVYNNSNGTGTTYCFYSNPVSTSIKNIYGNNVYSNSGESTIYGIYSLTGATVTGYQNQVYDISSTTTSTSIAYGIYTSTGTDVSWYNNFVSDIEAANSTSTTAAILWFLCSSGTNVGLYYNTVYLAYTGAATNNSAALYASSAATASLDLRNNIFVNNVDNSGWWYCICFPR